MADTGWVLCGTGTSNSAVGDDPWSNPERFAGTGSYSTASDIDSGQTSEAGEATNFGFSIPTGATIDGIEVKLDRSCNRADAYDHTVQLIKGGTWTGDNKSTGTNMPDNTSDPGSTDVTFGASNDTWSVSLTASDVNASNFGWYYRASASAKNQYVYSRAYYMKITYTESSGSGPLGAFWFLNKALDGIKWLPKKPKLILPKRPKLVLPGEPAFVL